MRTLGFDPVHDVRRTFDALLSAMSRPGTTHRVPEPADHAVLAALVDHEVTVATDDDALETALANHGRLDRVGPAEADVVHAPRHSAWDVEACKRGTLVEPSEGATIVYRVDSVSAGNEIGTTLELSGPGVDGTETLSVTLSERDVMALKTAQSEFPRGVDAIVAAPSSVTAIPRSASIEVM